MASKKVLEGEFYTPRVWVDKAHEYLEKTLGSNWRDNFVWDCAAGRGALTENYLFKRLVISTLNQEDIDFINQENINPEAIIKFSFDFLNDPDTKLPLEVAMALTQLEEIVFFINPPYGKGKGKDENTTDIANTQLNKQMLGGGMGRASAQLYCQFLYRICKFADTYGIKIKLALFSAPLFMTANSNKKFREFFYDHFTFKAGFLVNSKTFEDIEDWGLSFTIWETGENKNENIILDVFDLDKEGSVLELGRKRFYSIKDTDSGAVWVKQEVKKKKKTDVPKLKNPITVVDDNKAGKGCLESFGFLHIHGNNVLYNESLVGLYSSSYFFTIAGIPIIRENFLKCTSFFMARKVIDRTWINEKDEYLKPNEQHPGYKQWENDSIVYALFNNSSNQSSLRNVIYKKNIWDIKNEFFWMSRNKMLELVEQYDFPEMREDLLGSEERYVFELLQEKEISPEFKKILNLINDLVIKSFPKRREFALANPQFHLHAWDAGYAQLKPFWKEYFMEDFRVIKKEYRNLSLSLVDKVYELGFLKK